MKTQKWIGAIIGIIGITLIWCSYDWKLALGVFLCVLGNNAERNLRA